MKTCKTCENEKPESDYYRDGRWLRNSCKDCTKSKRRAYVERNREKVLEAVREYYHANAEQCRAKNNAYYHANKETLREQQADYYRRNKHKFLALNSTARAALYQATPSWLTDQQRKEIKDIYAMRDMMVGETGEQHHVDHIVPLRGKNVCGLHVPHNLRVITAQENLMKGNRYDQ